MTGNDTKNCWGCVHRMSRMRGSAPRTWCKKYHTPTNVRCLDYCYKPKAISLALAFVRRMAIK